MVHNSRPIGCCGLVGRGRFNECSGAEHDVTMKRRRSELILHAAILATALLPSVAAESAFAQAAEGRVVDREYYIKAAFLYHFSNFVDWPDTASSQKNITIGILGTDPFGEALATINGKMVKGRRIVLKKFRTLSDLEPCEILFISTSERGNLAKIMDAVKDWNALTVSDIDGFAKHWGTINFVPSGNKVRFELNVDAAKRRQLRVSSRLLRVATIVTDEHNQREPG